jgi:hypothetical protein
MCIDDVLCPLCSSLLKEKIIKNKIYMICSENLCYYKHETQKVVFKNDDDIYNIIDDEE